MPNRPNFGCPEAEPLFASYLDATLDATTLALLEAHLRDCPACAAELKLVRQGKEWLGIRRADDAYAVPSDRMVQRILAATSLASGKTALATGTASPAPAKPAPWANVNMAAVRAGMTRTGLMDARLMMTAAMAFFSITLTMNVMGIRLGDLRPGNLRHTVTRTYFDTNARVVRYYENMRVVYELESRMREMRRAAEQTEPVRKPGKPMPQASPQSNRRTAPMNDGEANGKPGHSPKSAEPEPAPAIRSGEVTDANLLFPDLTIKTPERSMA